MHERTLGFPSPFPYAGDGPGYILGSRHDERDDTRGLPNTAESGTTAETRAAATPRGQRILLEHTSHRAASTLTTGQSAEPKVQCFDASSCGRADVSGREHVPFLRVTYRDHGDTRIAVNSKEKQKRSRREEKTFRAPGEREGKEQGGGRRKLVESERVESKGAPWSGREREKKRNVRVRVALGTRIVKGRHRPLTKKR